MEDQSSSKPCITPQLIEPVSFSSLFAKLGPSDILKTEEMIDIYTLPNLGYVGFERKHGQSYLWS